MNKCAWCMDALGIIDCKGCEKSYCPGCLAIHTCPTEPPPPLKTTLTDGSPVTPDHREIDPKTGMQKGYIVLSEEERSKGFVRPVRRTYKHLKCGTETTMAAALAETYARQPTFYSATYCATCRAHFPVGPNGEFVWEDTDEKVGT